MTLTDLCIELRPNLRSGIVYLQFDHNIRDRIKTRITIKEHDVYVMEVDGEHEAHTLVIRQNCFGMDIEGISVFTSCRNHISFRFNYTQIDMDALEQSTVEVEMKPLLLQCQENDEFSLICRCCGSELVPVLRYKRLREFPTCVVDPSEFFCHNHGPGTGKEPSLLPAVGDLFYGLNYVVVNLAATNTNITQRDTYIYCRRCLRMVGQKIINNKTGKLWADSVYWLPPDQPKSQGREFFQHSSLTQLVKRLLYSLWPQPPDQLCLTSSRALVVTSLPTRQQHYMLIHVVDSQLRVLRRLRPNDEQLQCHRATQLYFGVYGECKLNLKELHKWQREQTFPQMEISFQMFSALQHELNLNAQLIPMAWRYNTYEEKLMLSYFFHKSDGAQPPPATTITTSSIKQPSEEQYETDAGHASQEEESDDEHSDTDSEERTGPSPIALPKRSWPPASPSPPGSDSN